MKGTSLCLLLVFLTTIGGRLAAQDNPISPSFVKTGVYHGLTPALKDLPVLSKAELQQMIIKNEQKMLNQKLKERHYPYAKTALPQGPDPVWQQEMGKTRGVKAPEMNFSGQTSPYYPPDANGAIGPGYYMQTINTVYAIYNKTTGTLAAGPTALNQLFSGVTGSQYNDGDPVCLYDEQADRWLVAEFSVSGTNDYMLIAVSATNDPTGAWHKYSFDVADMPDYEKFGIWRDGYYMGTNNNSGNDIYVFERSQMLNGLTAQMVGFNNPWRPTTIDGFMCVPPIDNDGAFAPVGAPGLFITINDDAIGGGYDQLWIYELAVNWASPSSSTFTRSQQLNVPAFDSNFGSNWDNIKQKGTTKKLDAIPMVIMNVPHYRNFGSYQTIVCCHTVDVDATNHAGIRWYELRRTTGTWTLRQSGTYAPDANSRWMGSIALNGSNEIGLGYSISNSSIYPGIRYCGQSASAYGSASGVLDISEMVIQNGSSSQTAYNRWGDYSAISIDPSNDHTFWFTSEYGGSRQTKIASFNFTIPVLTAQFAGTPTAVCPGGQVTFMDQSTGSPTAWNWTFQGGTPTTSTLQNPIVTYNTTGVYNVTLTVTNSSSNNTLVKTGYIEVAGITADFFGSPTTVSVGSTVAFTDNTFCNPTSWSWSFPGGTPASSTEQNPIVTYNTLGTYAVSLIATNASGSDTESKSGYINVIQPVIIYCASQSSVYSYEWIGQVAFNGFINASGASGYTNFTDLTIPLTTGGNVAVTLTPQFASGAFMEYWRVWIDYNKDGDFLDAGETVFAPPSSNSPVSGNFTVPSSLTGTTRMRVAMKYNADPTPCELFSYGEVEDYTVSFGEQQTLACSSALAPLNGTTGVSIATNLQWSNIPDATGYTLYFGTNDPPTNILNGTNVGNVTTYDPSSDLSYSSTYYWKVVPYNANGSASGCAIWSFTTEDSPVTIVQLSYSDFEAGWGIWTDGGGDCARYTGGTYSSGGAASIDIQDNSGTASSFYLTNGVDVQTPCYVQIDVEFEFIAVSLENNEDFWVQYYNGSTWNTVTRFVYPADFNNNIFYHANVSILESAYTFPVNMKIRFMCDASDNNDDVYIDNVKISASTQANPNNYIIPLNGPQDGPEVVASTENSKIKVYPNPAHNELNISIENSNLAEIFIYDMKGVVVYHDIINNGQQIVGLESFNTGLYMVFIITPEETFRTKFIKK